MSEHKLRVSAKGFFFDKQGRVLLIMGLDSNAERTYWVTPGGGVEKGESLIAAVERELTEETGYEGKAQGVIFTQDYINKKSGRRSFEIFFNGELTSKKPLPDIVPDHKCRFFTEEEFKKITFLPEGINPFELKKEIKYSSYL